MADNKGIRGERDRNRIDANEPREVEYAHGRFPSLSHEVIKEDIKNFRRYIETNEIPTIERQPSGNA